MNCNHTVTRQNARLQRSLSTYIYIPLSRQMFAAELKTAQKSRDKQTICRLIESIPADKWIYLDGAEAVASYNGASIAAHSYGGSGINTYDRIFLTVLWPDLTIDNCLTTYLLLGGPCELPVESVLAVRSPLKCQNCRTPYG